MQATTGLYRTFSKQVYLLSGHGCPALPVAETARRPSSTRRETVSTAAGGGRADGAEEEEEEEEGCGGGVPTSAAAPPQRVLLLLVPSLIVQYVYDWNVVLFVEQREGVVFE